MIAYLWRMAVLFIFGIFALTAFRLVGVTPECSTESMPDALKVVAIFGLILVVAFLAGAEYKTAQKGNG